MTAGLPPARCCDAWPRRVGTGEVRFGPDGSLYIADSGNHRVRKVSPDGIISNFAGNGSVPTFSGPVGDGGAAVSALLNAPKGLAFGPDGSLYIADSDNARVRRVAPDGTISTVAGKGPTFVFDRPDDVTTPGSVGDALFSQCRRCVARRHSDRRRQPRLYSLL